jgi:F0F1-type ATP synthase assembly protein I
MVEKPIKKVWYTDSIQMFTRLSGWILVPLVVGYTLGRYLDNKFQSEPRWFFISIGLAFIISTIGIVYQAQIEYKKIITPKK